MRRQKPLCLSLSRLAQATMAVLITLVLAGAARADTIVNFSIANGMAQNVTTATLGTCAAGAFCPFSGTIMVDVTAGLVTAYNILFPGLAAFNNCCTFQGPFFSSSNIWVPVSVNNDDALQLNIATTHTPASLVGFTGGSITGVVFPIGGKTVSYANLSGTISAASRTISAAPEPSSLALLGTGLIGLGGMVRRKLKR